MGAPLAVVVAVLYMAINGETRALTIFAEHLALYRRFIDDIFFVWICHPNPAIDAARYALFKERLNAAPGLTWITTDLSKSVNFLDMTITLRDDNTFTTTQSINSWITIVSY